MTMYDLAVWSGMVSGKPCAAAVLCAPGTKRETEQLLCGLRDEAVPSECDPIQLDRCLSEMLDRLLPRGTPAAAMTFAAWESGPVSGGIIGAPHTQKASAGGVMEMIGTDLWCWAQGGGPGFVISCGRQQAIAVQCCVEKAKFLGEDIIQSFLDGVEQHDVRYYLFAADGSGSRGCILAAAGDERAAIYLEEFKR